MEPGRGMILTDTPHGTAHLCKRPLAYPIRCIPQGDDGVGAASGKIATRRLELRRHTGRCMSCELELLTLPIARVHPVVEPQDRLKIGIGQYPCLSLASGDEYFVPTPFEGNLVCLHSLLVGRYRCRLRG